MKQFIVLMAMIALGLFIYQCIAGPDQSVLTALAAQWHRDLATHPYAAAQAASDLRGGGALCSSSSCWRRSCRF